MYTRELVQLKRFLDAQVVKYNQPDFIPHDPIAIPHTYKKMQDIEIAGFLAATLSWGQRKVIIKKSRELLDRMDAAPHDFILNHQANDLNAFSDFKHRTFNATDVLYFIRFLKHYYQRYDTLETAFLAGLVPGVDSIELGLIYFHQLFLTLSGAPKRTCKHVATPAHKATCKRLNMFLRWMVRKDEQGVDFGLWKQIKPHQLVCPCDVHVARVSRAVGLIKRKHTDWQAVMELTHNLRQLSPEDPIRYDFALFSLGLYNMTAF